jgi:Contractile injection system tube protein
MTTLESATLTILKVVKPERDDHPATVSRDPKSTVSVQFNPNTLKLAYQHHPDQGGVGTKAQRRQYASAQPATLSFDLEYDTAEEQGVNQTTGKPNVVNVRVQTAEVRKFVQPPPDKPSAAPPRVQFQWGTLIFNGIITSVNEDLDYFAPDGTPLRAKLTVTITEQNLLFEGKASGPGARKDTAATQPGGVPDRPASQPPPGENRPPGATPGRSGTREPERVLPAVDGESVQQLATRAGGSPAAWRSLMNGLDSPLAIPGGTPVDIGPELEEPATVGRSAGFAAGATASAVESLAGVLGLAPPAGTDVAAPSPASLAPGLASTLPTTSSATDATEAVGFVLSAAGGVGAAVTRVLAEQAAQSTVAARASFEVPPAVSSAAPSVPSAASGEVLDPRVVSYGRAIPLRARLHLPTLADLEAGGRRSLAARAQPAEVTPSGDSGSAPWERLPQTAAGRPAADLAQRSRDARPSTMRWRPGGECR